MSWNPALDLRCLTGAGIDVVETLILPRACALERRRCLRLPPCGDAERVPLPRPRPGPDVCGRG